MALKVALIALWVISISFFVSALVFAQDTSHGNSYTSGNVTIYEDGTTAVKQGKDTFYTNGQVTTEIHDGSTYNYIPPGTESQHNGYGSSFQIRDGYNQNSTE